MKTFADYLPTMTAREREIVIAYERAMVYARDADQNTATPFELLLATPPAKEPEWIEREVRQSNLGTSIVRLAWPGFKPGDRVRVVKIEEMK